MEKASIKHLDFQLQREKARSKDLEVECKALHAQIAQLEQDKASLRREKLVLIEEAKKISKLDDRVHSLQKELENRDAIISAERAAAEQARAETEEIRSNANASIAQWVEAEKQWTAEQEALNSAATSFRSQIGELEAALLAQKSEFAETTRSLEAERERCRKVAETRDRLEVEVKGFHAHAEKLQNKICDLEQTVYKLNFAGDRQKETIDLKETEIRTLETALESERKTTEKLEQTISALNDRINAVKMVRLEDKGENEKLQCDLSDARKEIARLTLHVETLKRDSNFAAQSQAGLQKALDEMREKCRQQQDDIKEKSVEIRRHELTISQLHVELKKSENQGGEWSFQNSSLESELQRTKEALKNALNAVEVVTAEKNDLLAKTRQLQTLIDTKDEEMVMLQSQADEKTEMFTHDIRSLEKEVAARQGVINDLSEQLNATSEKNATYHTKILEKAEIESRFASELAQVHASAQAQEQRFMLCQCEAEKTELFSTYVSEQYEAFQHLLCGIFTSWQDAQVRVAELTSTAARYAQNIADANVTVAHQEEVLRAKCATVDQLTEQLKEKERALVGLSAVVVEREENIGALHAELKAAQDRRDALVNEVETLNEQIILTNASMEEKDAQVATIRARFQSDLSAAFELNLRALQTAGDRTAELQALWETRVTLVADYLSSSAAQERSEKMRLADAKEQLEATCRELTTFAKEARAAMSKGDRAMAEKQEALLSRITLLEGQAALLQREKEQAATQLAALLRRFEDAQRTHETCRRDAQAALEAEQAKCAAAERGASKLRSALQYEVARKGEYKTALEGAKKLLSESEEMRAADSARALDAIKKANKESDYWVLCFDRLKALVEQSRKNGKRLPSIDADTIHRLEEAKTEISPVQAQDVNGSAPTAPKLKRMRDEGNALR